MEEVISGDCSGNPENISSGTTSGAIVNAGPEVIGKKKKKDSKQDESEDKE